MIVGVAVSGCGVVVVRDVCVRVDLWSVRVCLGVCGFCVEKRRVAFVELENGSGGVAGEIVTGACRRSGCYHVEGSSLDARMRVSAEAVLSLLRALPPPSNGGVTRLLSVSPKCMFVGVSAKGGGKTLVSIYGYVMRFHAFQRFLVGIQNPRDGWRPCLDTPPSIGQGVFERKLLWIILCSERSMIV